MLQTYLPTPAPSFPQNTCFCRLGRQLKVELYYIKRLLVWYFLLLFSRITACLTHLKPYGSFSDFKAYKVQFACSDPGIYGQPLCGKGCFWDYIHTAIGKKLDSDGFPLNYNHVNFPFRAVFWVIFIDQFHKGKMTKFQRRAQVSLMHTTGDRKLLSNY